jgi:hypothetical protein
VYTSINLERRGEHMKWIVAVGNAFEGITFQGPFDNADQALKYGKVVSGGGEWSIVPMDEPEPEWSIVSMNEPEPEWDAKYTQKIKFVL